ncbi:MAG TPA: ATP-binding protein [Sphingopyxis sp.]|nr:ATP-binding protein [Sphingopyxis sp.]
MIGRRPIFGVILPILTIGVFALLLAFSFMRLSAIDKNMRIEMTQNMLWVVSRSQVSTLQLQEAVTFRSLGLNNQVDVDQAFSVFLGQFSILNDGPQRRHIDRLGYNAAMDRMAQARPHLAELTRDVAMGDSERVQEIHTILGPYEQEMARAANKAMVEEWDRLGTKLDKFRYEISTILVSLLAILLAGGGMTLHLAQATRKAHVRARLLERERAFSQLLIQSSSETIIAVDLERRCTMWNEPAAALFHRSAEGVLGENLSDASVFFCSDAINHMISMALKGRPDTLSDQPLHSDSETVFLDLRSFPLRDGADIIGSILILSDVTVQHQARREVQERRDYLEAEVRQRTAELNAALSRERAATDIYRNFAAMVSHQFRTPVAIVDSTLQRLIRRADRIEPADLIARCDQARGAVARLIRLIESTLDAARMDAGQIERRLEGRDLVLLAQAALQCQRDETPERSFLMVDDGPRIALCDPVHAEHIIVNLLSNAAKYAREHSEIRIVVGACDGYATCTVINEGRVDPDERGSLFERYFRGTNGKEQNRVGLGIGLYMARSLARIQGGDVLFHEEGQNRLGFTLRLPLADAAEQDAAGIFLEEASDVRQGILGGVAG